MNNYRLYSVRLDDYIYNIKSQIQNVLKERDFKIVDISWTNGKPSFLAYFNEEEILLLKLALSPFAYERIQPV